MKTVSFHLMPYPDLPEDFAQTHRSVWVDIDPKLFDPKVAATLARTCPDAAVVVLGDSVALCQFGNMAKDVVLHNTELMATKVLPQVRHLFEDQWENRWWPKPLPQAERSVAMR